MSFSSRISRTHVRAFHLAASAILVADIYSPWGSEPWFRLLVQSAVVPLVAISGLWLWKGHKLIGWLSSKRSRELAPARP